MSATLITALALTLVLEGLLPFVAPAMWRETFRRMLALEDSQLRIVGFGAIALGLVLLRLFGP